MKKYKVIFTVGLLVMGMSMSMPVQAVTKTEVSAALGVDLSDLQIDKVLELVGVSKEELEENMDSEDVEELIAFVKEKLAAGELDTDEEIKEAIKEGEDKFQVTLTEEEKAKILKVVRKINELGMEPEQLLEQAKDVYKKIGNDLKVSAEETVKETVKNSVSDYFTDFGNRIKEFVLNIFS